MSDIPSQVSSLAQIIQLAVAPVFLLTSVGALLGVLSNRLARIIDAFHRIEKELLEESPMSDRIRNLSSAVSLSRRAKLIHWAIILCTTCYLLVCLVVVALFVGHELQVDVYAKIGGLFIAAMLTLITALGCYLREITLATSVIENLKRSAQRFDGRL